jgi:hypothetical protein
VASLRTGVRDSTSLAALSNVTHCGPLPSVSRCLTVFAALASGAFAWFMAALRGFNRHYCCDLSLCCLRVSFTVLLLCNFVVSCACDIAYCVVFM